MPPLFGGQVGAKWISRVWLSVSHFSVPPSFSTSQAGAKWKMAGAGGSASGGVTTRSQLHAVVVALAAKYGFPPVDAERHDAQHGATAPQFHVFQPPGQLARLG